MIRSGYHEHFDAMQATAPARADLNARLERMAQMMAPFHRLVASLGVSMADAAQRMGRAFAAINAAAVKLERPQDAPTKEDRGA